MLKIREYEERDWSAIEKIHDAARKIELELAGLEDAFLPLRIAAEREELFEYPGLYVAEEDGMVLGFTACTQEELAWLYVHPARRRRGIGLRLSEYAMEKFPGICRVEALQGNEPARALYKRLGFQVVAVEKGRMPGNEGYAVKVYCMERR